MSAATTSEWFDNLPDEVKTAPFIRPLEDGTLRDAAQIRSDLENAANLQGNLSTTHIKIPGKDAAAEDQQKAIERVLEAFGDKVTLRPDTDDPETLAKHFQSLGTPDRVEGYDTPELEGFDPEAANLDKVKEFALANHWTQQQYANYVQDVAAAQQGSQQQMTEWREQQDKILDDALGKARAERVSTTAEALRKLGSEDVADKILAGEVDARLVLTYNNLVQKMISMGGEGKEFAHQMGAGKPSELTPDEARAKFEETTAQMQTMVAGTAAYNKLMQKRVELASMM